MTKQDFLIGVLVASVTASVAYATTASAANDRTIDLEQMRATAAEQFDAVDTDADGLINIEEFQAADPREMRAARGRMGPRMGPRMDRHMRMGSRMARRMPGDHPEHEDTDTKVFDAADADGDGQLSAEEFAGRHEAAQSVRKAEMFARLDANDDGQLDPAEFPPHVARIAELDADGDGLISPDERPQRQFRHRRAHDQEDTSEAN